MLRQPLEIKYKTTQTLKKKQGLTIALEIPKYMLSSQSQETITNSLSDSDHIEVATLIRTKKVKYVGRL